MRQQAKIIRRRQILEAALATFADKGYDKTTMEDLRIAADVSKGTLYLYFATKEALFAAALETLFTDLLEQIEQAAAANHVESAAGRLQLFLDALNQMFDEEDERFGLYVDFFVQAWQHESVRVVLAAAYRQYISVLTTVMQQGIDAGEFYPVDAEAMARVVLGAMDGIMLQKLVDPVNFRPTLNALTAMVMRCLRLP